ncbi:MAG: uL15m family ribosomal protein [Candidatus Woesearchaeota archaeon]
MVVHKRKKNTRNAALTTHGWGSMKKHRGAGHRGGRGRAGSGKRGDQKKPLYWKDKDYFGKNGFTSKTRVIESVTINIKTLEDRAEALVSKGLMKSENGIYVVNLADIGYNKLLSTGNVTKKFNITVENATAKAIDKIKNVGGNVTVRSKKPSKSAKPADKPADKPAAPSKKSTAVAADSSDGQDSAK